MSPNCPKWQNHFKATDQYDIRAIDVFKLIESRKLRLQELHCPAFSIIVFVENYDNVFQMDVLSLSNLRASSLLLIALMQNRPTFVRQNLKICTLKTTHFYYFSVKNK